MTTAEVPQSTPGQTPSSQDPRSSVVRLESVTAGYGRRLVLRDVTFDVRRGDLLGLVGPNGGGKTTVLRLILGLMRPRSGRVIRGDPPLRYGYVPQRGTLDTAWPLKAIEVVTMGLYSEIGLFRRVGERHLARAAAALDDVGAASLADASYGELSGGQKQRVLVARALAADPEVLVLDEPTEGMDLPSMTGFARLVEDLVRERRLTVLWASHDLNTVASYADRIALVRRGGVRVGPSSELLTSASLSEAYEIPVIVSQVDGRRVVYGQLEGLDARHRAP